MNLYMYLDFSLCCGNLTRPHTNDAILARFRHVSVPYAYTFNNSRCPTLLSSIDTGTTVPLTRLELVVHLDNILASGTDNPAAVERHVRDGMVIRIGIMKRTSPKIPYLGKRSATIVKAEEQIRG